MEYKGKLYGRLGHKQYFDTSHTTDDWDNMVIRIAELEKENQVLRQPHVIGWVSVSDELPKEYKHRMSRDVLTIAGSKMIVKSYDFELGRWNGSPHITVTHWMELPSPPCR